MGILTTHRLAEELLRKEDKFITASDGEKDYVIEDFRLVRTHANFDDSCTYIQLNLKKTEGNIIR